MPKCKDIFYQGSLDNLCGLYATLNAVAKVCEPDDCDAFWDLGQALFRKLHSDPLTRASIVELSDGRGGVGVVQGIVARVISLCPKRYGLKSTEIMKVPKGATLSVVCREINLPVGATIIVVVWQDEKSKNSGHWLAIGRGEDRSLFVMDSEEYEEIPLELYCKPEDVGHSYRVKAQTAFLVESLEG